MHRFIIILINGIIFGAFVFIMFLDVITGNFSLSSILDTISKPLLHIVIAFDIIILFLYIIRIPPWFSALLLIVISYSLPIFLEAQREKQNEETNAKKIATELAIRNAPAEFVKDRFPQLYKNKNDIKQRMSIFFEKQAEALQKLKDIKTPEAQEFLKQEIIIYTAIINAFSAKIRVLEESYEILFALDKTGKDSKILEAEFKKVLNIATSVLEETKAIQEDLRTIN